MIILYIVLTHIVIGIVTSVIDFYFIRIWWDEYAYEIRIMDIIACGFCGVAILLFVILLSLDKYITNFVVFKRKK